MQTAVGIQLQYQLALGEEVMEEEGGSSTVAGRSQAQI